MIISNSKLNSSQDRICCLITSNPNADGIQIKKSAFEQGELPFESKVNPYRLFTIHEKIIKKKLCTVTKKFYERVVESIEEYLKTE